eukprot:CAMPEP_0171192410 /NCGR_PEP_ID=MMETSP0790-20130122/19856_1 /TAXON_ID=2925 /ORGANISM="Alexandrium catenella, Strain OF101" /LENGTH=243 /DNA_ID=CAMNT_0011657569 /DNA_START=62 /DNA_END=793 /DNA_ORIENTATION=+
MALASKLLSFGLCAVGMAAYQEMLLVGNRDKPQAKAKWPVQHSNIDFMRIVGESLGAIMDDPAVLANMEAQHKKDPSAPAMPTMEMSPAIRYKIRHKEPQTGVFLHYPKPCTTGENWETTCQTHLAKPGQQGTIHIVHALPYEANTSFAFSFNVKSGWVKQGSVAKCAACGGTCKGNFLGRTWTVDLPECPIPAGTFSLNFPFLLQKEMDILPPIPKNKLEFQLNIVRADGTTSVSFDGNMDA